jgi:alkylation response protein AidB-like acyl-CoA dehydrogenase
MNVARRADTLYHDLYSPAEVVDTRARARGVADRVIAPAWHRIANADESVASFPRDVFTALADAGLFRVPFTADHGGDGLVHRAMATASVIEELAYHSNSVAAIYDVHCLLAGTALASAHEALRGKHLARLMDGTAVAAFATTEPEASSDLSAEAVRTTAEAHAEGFRITGRKRFITNAPVADFVIVLCGMGSGHTAVLIETSRPGVRVSAPDRKTGNRGQLTADIVFDEVIVPRENVIGEAGRGLRVALQSLTFGRIGIAAAGVGMAQAAFDHAAHHLEQRRAFGRRLGENQYWQFRMAERALQLESARNLYLKAAMRMDTESCAPEPEAAMAKICGTELAVDMARDAVQIHGGYGFMRELADGSTFAVEAIYRDAKIGEIYEGTNEIQRWIVARTLFGRDITG